MWKLFVVKCRVFLLFFVALFIFYILLSLLVSIHNSLNNIWYTIMIQNMMTMKIKLYIFSLSTFLLVWKWHCWSNNTIWSANKTFDTEWNGECWIKDDVEVTAFDRKMYILWFRSAWYNFQKPTNKVLS